MPVLGGPELTLAIKSEQSISRSMDYIERLARERGGAEISVGLYRGAGEDHVCASQAGVANGRRVVQRGMVAREHDEVWTRRPEFRVARYARLNTAAGCRFEQTPEASFE